MISFIKISSFILKTEGERTDACTYTVTHGRTDWPTTEKYNVSTTDLYGLHQWRRHNFAPGGHRRVAHGFRSSWWQSHPEVKEPSCVRSAKFACIRKLQAGRPPVPHAWRRHWSPRLCDVSLTANYFVYCCHWRYIDLGLGVGRSSAIVQRDWLKQLHILAF